MVGRVSLFAELYRLCVPELKSEGWQIQDGGRDPGTLNNVLLFTTLQHAINIMLWRIRKAMEPFLLMSDYVHVTKFQNGRHFHKQ